MSTSTLTYVLLITLQMKTLANVLNQDNVDENSKSKDDNSVKK